MVYVQLFTVAAAELTGVAKMVVRARAVVLSQAFGQQRKYGIRGIYTKREREIG